MIEKPKHSGSVVQFWLAVAIFGCVVNGVGCSSLRASDLNAYRTVPMNRVVPYPSQDERQHRFFEVIVVDRPSDDIDDAILEIPRAKVRRALERFTVEAGSVVMDRAPGDSSGIGTERIASEFDADAINEMAQADYALVARFLTYRSSSKWNEPFKFLWQTPEDVATKPGTCHHTVEVEFDVRVIRPGTDGGVEKTFLLEHTAEQKNPDIDPLCTISPVTLSVLFETALDEALSCLRFPLGAFLAPHGHITSHRETPGALRHIYRISLGSAQGIVRGDTVEIRREQRSRSPGGEESRSERVISLGRVTDQVKEGNSWIAVDLSKATEEILEGDIARPIESESLLASLSGPNCGAILDEH